MYDHYNAMCRLYWYYSFVSLISEYKFCPLCDSIKKRPKCPYCCWMKYNHRACEYASMKSMRDLRKKRPADWCKRRKDELSEWILKEYNEVNRLFEDERRLHLN